MTSNGFKKWVGGFLWRLALLTLWPIYIPLAVAVLVVSYVCTLVAGVCQWLFVGKNTILAEMDRPSI